MLVIAIKEFLGKLESKRLLNALNKTYSTPETEDEKKIREFGRKQYASEILKDKY